MSNPRICPVCELETIERILDDVQIAAKIDGKGENVSHGVIAYRCTQNGHIFFLRHSDVTEFRRNQRYDEGATRRTVARIA